MKRCPQCNSHFGDDYYFCLNDGTMLYDGSDEVETRVGQRVQMPISEPIGPMHPCDQCGMSNRLNSKFCKKCGAAVAPPADPPPSAFGGYSAAGFEETQHFQQGMFTPPTPVASSAPRSDNINTNVLLGAILGSLVLVGGIVIYSIMPGDDGSNKAVNANRTVNKPANTPVQNVHTSRPNDSRIGKTGTLTTDVNIRPIADANATKLGTHYQGARVEILDVADGVTKDGTTMTFFKIRVLSYGTSTDSTNYGLDKDFGTPDEGWVNGYPVLYGRRQDLISFD